MIWQWGAEQNLLHTSTDQVTYTTLGFARAKNWDKRTDKQTDTTRYRVALQLQILDILSQEQRNLFLLWHDYWTHCPMIIGHIVQWLLDTLSNIFLCGLISFFNENLCHNSHKWHFPCLVLRFSCSYQPYWYSNFWSERSAWAALGCRQKQRWPLF